MDFFLADRNALIIQALKNYNEYLPSLTGTDLTKEQDQGSARIVFSTYQTIINKIDEDYCNGKRYYGVGHFDLIIVDEYTGQSMTNMALSSNILTNYILA